MEEKLYELKKCCGQYPRYHVTKEGTVYLQCQVCDRRTDDYMSANLSANKSWNKMLYKRLDREEA